LPQSRRRRLKTHSSSWSLRSSFVGELLLKGLHLVSQESADHDSVGGRVSTSRSESAAERWLFRDDSSIVDTALDNRHAANGSSNLIDHVQELVFIDMLQIAVVRENLQSLLNDDPQNDQSNVVSREGGSQRVAWCLVFFVGIFHDFSFFDVLVVGGFILRTFLFRARVTVGVHDSLQLVRVSSASEANTPGLPGREPSRSLFIAHVSVALIIVASRLRHHVVIV